MSRKEAKQRIIKSFKSITVNISIAFLVFLALYLTYSLVFRTTIRPPIDQTKEGTVSGEIIQLDVLNGCGVAGVAGKFTEFLRIRGYDVVEMGNYRTFDVPESIVIDRTGNIENARKVAYALGIKESNVIQQINLDYFLDVTVVIGHDYELLRPMR